MAQLLSWKSEPDAEGIVRQATAALQNGQIVAFPTETVYGLAASAQSSDGVAALLRGKQRPAEKPMALAFARSEDVLSWVPRMGAVGERLARRCWPGPLTLVFDQVDSDPVRALPEAVRQAVCPNGTLGVRVPDHDVILRVIESLGMPLALTSANISGQPPALTAEQVQQAVGDEAAFIVDDGACRLGQPSTVVRVSSDRWTILREGALTVADLEAMSACLILFVCTGNTCRSPLAEGICKKQLAEKLGCTIEELPRKGYLVLSAGIAAHPGFGAAEEAVQTAAKLGVDLSKHVSQPLTPALLRQADYIITMTGQHLQALQSYYPDGEKRMRMLCSGGEDLDDPIGGDDEVYRACAQTIQEQLVQLLPQLQK